MPERLENQLKQRRSECGLTQGELAEQCLVSRKTINTVENGIFIPSTMLALKLAAALDCPVDQLFWLSDD